jgi:hypothetical protein
MRQKETPKVVGKLTIGATGSKSSESPSRSMTESSIKESSMLAAVHNRDAFAVETRGIVVV